MGTIKTNLINLLEEIVPFRFLSHKEKVRIASHLQEKRYGKDEVIIDQGDDNIAVYLLDTGSVGIYDKNINVNIVTDVIYAKHYFGEWSSIFRNTRSREVRAREDVRCYELPGEMFLELIEKNASFAQAMGEILRDSQGIFDSFDRFEIELARSIDRGYISIHKLLPIYLDLHPVLHAHANDPYVIDGNALRYAVQRLPENVTHTLAFLLTDEMPYKFDNPDALFKNVAAKARRREIWEMLPGKNMIVMRHGLSDIVDFITCLCLYSVEMEKIRSRIESYKCILTIKNKLQECGDTPFDNSEFMKMLPFSEKEQQDLIAIWGQDTVRFLYEIACHREMFSIDVRRRRSGYNSRRTDIWTWQIKETVKKLIGVSPSQLPKDVPVYIISSNIHSVINCLNPYFRQHHQSVLDWVDKVNHPLGTVKWENEQDCVYAAARDFFEAFPKSREEMESALWKNGIAMVENTASTGIQVQIIDMSKLDYDNIDIDITKSATPKKGLIVNIDYAFGEQAEQVMRNLLMLFGCNIKSINFFGKAGGIVGERGDVMSPTAFVEQRSDVLRPFAQQNSYEVQFLHTHLPHNKIHSGAMLTVAGTLLQNSIMLNFYQRVWHCIGIEMEGSYYYRSVLEARQLGIVNEDLNLCFLYYVSDIPLNTSINLSKKLSASEGVPTLYAITRAILSKIIR